MGPGNFLPMTVRRPNAWNDKNPAAIFMQSIKSAPQLVTVVSPRFVDPSGRGELLNKRSAVCNRRLECFDD
jgi:hypothetical protein